MNTTYTSTEVVQVGTVITTPEREGATVCPRTTYACVSSRESPQVVARRRCPRQRGRNQDDVVNGNKGSW